MYSADPIAPERRSKSERTCDRRKNCNGFLLTHGSAIHFRCAFLVKPHPVLRRRYSMFLAARPPPTPFVPFAFLIAVISNLSSLSSPRISSPRRVCLATVTQLRASVNHCRDVPCDTTGPRYPLRRGRSFILRLCALQILL